MNYAEALQHKKESIDKADESLLKLYHIIIAPSNTEESYKYIQDFTKKTQKISMMRAAKNIAQTTNLKW